MLDYITSIILVIVLHEFGHLAMALSCCRKNVQFFSIGFGKPWIKWKYNNIEWRITPWLIGGQVGVDDEGLKYYQKFLIIIGGLLINILLFILLSLINYKSIYDSYICNIGIIKFIYFNDTELLNTYFIHNDYNFLISLNFLNFIALVFNMIPIPPLDGGMLWGIFLKPNILKKINKWTYRTLILICILINLVWFIK